MYGTTTTISTDRRIRWEPEYIDPADLFDTPEFASHVEAIRAGDRWWLYAIVEEVCDHCGAWHVVDSLGGIDAALGCDPMQIARREGLASGYDLDEGAA